MRRISHDTYASVLGVAYLVLMTNALLLVAALPLVVLLVVTDPIRSWPLIAIAGALAAPGVTAAFSVFRRYSQGSTSVARDFVAGYRSTWRKALAVGGMLSAAVVVLLVDIRALSDLELAIVVVPALAVLVVLALAIGLHALVALAEDPAARLRHILRASLYLSVRRWHLALFSLAVFGVQAVLFTSLPALAIGITASGALYLAWSNARYALRPILHLDTASAD